MTTSNFTLEKDFIGILYSGKYLDLHNNFLCVNFEHDKSNMTAELSFTKSIGDRVSEDELGKFTIQFDNVKSVYQKDHDTDYPKEYISKDVDTVDIFGFSYDDDEIMDGPTDTIPRNDLPSLIFVFVTGKAIKVTAESARLLLN